MLMMADTHRFPSSRASHESCEHAWTEATGNVVEQLELTTFAAGVWHAILHRWQRKEKVGKAVPEAKHRRVCNIDE